VITKRTHVVLGIALWSLLVAGVAVATPKAGCVDRKELILRIGGTDSFGPLKFRLDSANLKEIGPDDYQISLKDEDTDAILANHLLVIQRQTIQVKTKCGDVSIGMDRAGAGSDGYYRINISTF